MSEPYRGPDPQSWSSDDLDGLSPEERRRQVEGMLRRVLEESSRRVGELRPGDISDRKGALPTITHLVSTREERSRPGRGTGA
ncbi:hypothetical protein [Cellulomonas sp. IC4_254]|uniref:hypothetical protein n=1 Tax=Cellulomonas sp. IC4_254 TaxID=2714040 RepID=UPI0014235FA6|nr:hypothetical protein [Cellulomonas sp. IC4_254]NHT19070.1 hypothetical protein [Cellulomonas sp. IC4_254]